jgi:CRISPR/Cas system-associated endonuclease Cas1
VCASSFSISGSVIENVNVYAHLGHIITSSFNDLDDTANRRNSFISHANTVLYNTVLCLMSLQTNTMLCFF